MSNIKLLKIIPMRIAKVFFYVSLVIYIVLCSSLAIAKVPIPSLKLDIDLKKDQILKASISASKNSNGDVSNPKQFTLRWTLYRNEGLVVLVRYDNYPYQFILYKQYMTNVWKLNLLDTQGAYREISQPYLSIKFVGIDYPFNDENTIAHLRISGYGNIEFSQE
ncbi:hypothetical protein LS73_003650 [Helicobacter muridarum]|uniref:Uncharacterized protein n=1 Tax=Helicobacter muridarum TaxID=216 RepID=A0A099TXX2_9HELI|nr:hypothetical protein [Helicobacter muridarum]TLE00757.1 hypothetical protein LS73_003650 [Helicobacter muridarum]STQ86563.1 Uncharacterised protein [Helicobacter muridarum]